MKLCINTTLEASDILKFKMVLFENGYPEGFLLFKHNYQIMLKVSGNITACAKIQYLRTLIYKEVIRGFETLCGEIGSSTTVHLKQILLVFKCLLSPNKYIAKEKWRSVPQNE